MILTKRTSRNYFSPRNTTIRKFVGRVAFIGVAGAVLLTPDAAKAQLTFTFAQPVQSATTGSTVSFFANIRNTGTEQIIINGFNPGLTASGLTINDLFFANVPDTLQPGDGGLYQVFSVAIGTDAVPGTYVGLAQVDYETPTATQQRVTQPYSLSVSAVAVPESSSAVVMAMGGLGITLIHYRKRRQTNKGNASTT